MSQKDLSPDIYEQIVENSPIGVVLTETKNEEGDRPITYVNSSFEEMTGYQEEEVLGEDCRFLQGEETDQYTIDSIRNALENEESVTAVLENYTRDGELFYNRLELQPVYSGGDIEGFVGYQIDVTEMVSERKEKDLLLRIVNHDLRNDISVIEGWTKLAMDQDSDYERVDSKIQHIKGTLDAVEAYRQLGKAENVDSVNVSELLSGKVESYRLEDNELQIDSDIEPEMIGQSGVLLDSLYENLLGNIEAHAEADRVLVSGYKDNGEIITGIEDDGVGLPDNVRELFKEGNKDDHSSGMGLGLFIVDRISESYGLEVEVFDSDLGGAGFKVRIPEAD